MRACGLTDIVSNAIKNSRNSTSVYVLLPMFSAVESTSSVSILPLIMICPVMPILISIELVVQGDLAPKVLAFHLWAVIQTRTYWRLSKRDLKLLYRKWTTSSIIKHNTNTSLVSEFPEGGVDSSTYMANWTSELNHLGVKLFSERFLSFLAKIATPDLQACGVEWTFLIKWGFLRWLAHDVL